MLKKKLIQITKFCERKYIIFKSILLVKMEISN